MNKKVRSCLSAFYYLVAFGFILDLAGPFLLKVLMPSLENDLLTTAFVISILTGIIFITAAAVFLKCKLIPISLANEKYSGFIQNLANNAVESSTGAEAPEPGTFDLDQQLRTLSANSVETRKRERAIIDNAVDVICVIDFDSCFLSLSPSAQRNWGYSNEELVGKKLTEFINVEDSSTNLEAILGAKHSIEKVSFENRLKHKDGHLIELSWSAHWSIKDNGLFCVARDITERKLAEARLLESEQRIRTTLQAMPVGVLCAGQNGYIEFANECLERFTKLRSADLLTRTVFEIVAPNERAKMTECLAAAAKNENLSAQQSMEFSIAQDTHTYLTVEVSATIFTVNSILKYLITYTDITQRKEMEQFKREFMAMVNHDLRTPLTSIGASVALLEGGGYGELSSKGKQLCSIVASEIERLRRLAGDLLELEKIESGKLTVEKEDLSLREIFEASRSSMLAYAQLKEIQIVIPDTDDHCWGEQARIIQVLVNLLSNAVKFSPDRSVITIAVVNANDKVTISVSDQGRGIPKEKTALLFQRFQQVRPNDSIEKSGLGLGLSICRGIIDAHGGKIGCESADNAGTTFWFTLPVKLQS